MISTQSTAYQDVDAVLQRKLVNGEKVNTELVARLNRALIHVDVLGIPEDLETDYSNACHVLKLGSASYEIEGATASLTRIWKEIAKRERETTDTLKEHTTNYATAGDTVQLKEKAEYTINRASVNDDEDGSSSSSSSSAADDIEFEEKAEGVNTGKAQNSYSEDKPDIPPNNFKESAEKFRRIDNAYLAREATDPEICLSAEEVSGVLAKLFQSASGQFNMGLFAPWGRGKSSLLKLLQKKLSADYEVLNFSAWKYRTNPELWIHLHETCIRKIKNGGLNSFLSRTIRANIAKNGLGTFVICLLLILFTLIPITHKIDGAWWIANALGLGGILFVVRIACGVNIFSTRTVKHYLTLSSHKEKLGFQEILGEDFKSIFLGWIPNTYFNTNKNMVLGIIAISIGLLIGLTLYPEQTFIHSYFGEPPTSVPVVTWLIFLSWVALFIYLIGVTTLGGRKTKRVLLAIDDLDRIEPDKMLEVIESLNLFLEEPEVKERVQVIMLVEPEMLCSSILKKYKDILNKSNRTASAVIRENIEKLFNVHLTLSSLAPREINDLVYNFGVKEKLTPTPVSNGNGSYTMRMRPVTAKPEPKNTEVKSVDAFQDLEFKHANLSYDECQQLLTIIHILNQEHSQDWTPRSIRSFVFKYQLSKLLLTALNVQCSDREIIRHLGLAYRRENNPADLENATDVLIDKIVSQTVQIRPNGK